MLVQLRAARIPWVGWLAVHHWFVVETVEVQRWEVWQQRGLIATSWGHLYLNLLSPVSGVGSGESWLEGEWGNDDASRLVNTLHNSPADYPYCHQYRYWPGPNSNTYVKWILKQSGVNPLLSWQAIGQNYIG